MEGQPEGAEIEPLGIIVKCPRPCEDDGGMERMPGRIHSQPDQAGRPVGVAMSHDDEVRRQINLAEFSALRSEIDNRANLQWNIFALQLTAAGVIFSFALSNPNHTGFLLILPLTTYAFAGRYLSQYLGTERIGAYIREVLSPKLNGELLWEDWYRDRRSHGAQALNWLNPLVIAFPGVATIALIWVAPYVWSSADTSAAKRVLIASILVSRHSSDCLVVSVDCPYHLTSLAKASPRDPITT
jgi:hypothetical protein